MKNLEIMGVQEMDTNEMKVENGGIVFGMLLSVLNTIAIVAVVGAAVYLGAKYVNDHM